MKALILAGGQGLRLRPLTEDKPKPLVPVNERPIAEWQIDWLKSNVKLEKVVFLCGYKWEKLKSHFGSNYKGIPIEYSVEETPLGTGGAIREGLALLGDTGGNVVVTNGDIVTDMPLRSMVASHEAPGTTPPTVTMLLVPYRSRFGIVYIDKLKVVRKFEEKPEFPDVWINGGIYVINAQKILKHLPEKGDVERETFPKLVQYAEIVSYPYYGYWSLIDSIKDLHEAEKELKTLEAQATG
jgi:NDP-sugar pyrophosphorylase family protein